jgi:hypothetical protein
VPGVSLLFFLGYFFTDSMVNLVKDEAETVKSIIVMVVVVGVAAYFLYRFLRRPLVTGDPQEVPSIVNPMQGALNQMTNKIMHPSENGQPDAASGSPASTEQPTSSQQNLP